MVTRRDIIKMGLVGAIALTGCGPKNTPTTEPTPTNSPTVVEETNTPVPTATLEDVATATPTPTPEDTSTPEVRGGPSEYAFTIHYDYGAGCALNTNPDSEYLTIDDKCSNEDLVNLSSVVNVGTWYQLFKPGDVSTQIDPEEPISNYSLIPLVVEKGGEYDTRGSLFKCVPTSTKEEELTDCIVAIQDSEGNVVYRALFQLSGFNWNDPGRNGDNGPDGDTCPAGQAWFEEYQKCCDAVFGCSNN